MMQTTKSSWQVIVPGYRPFTMAGVKMNQAEALKEARVIWPNAEVK